VSAKAEGRTWAVAVAALLGFVVVVAIEHAAERSLRPLEHMVSEYARTDTGWLMTLGFLLWALSLAATAFNLRGVSPILAALLLLAALAVLVVATFRTQTSVGELAYGDRFSPQGRLHDLGSGLATLALVAAALASIRLGSRGLGRGIAVLLVVALCANFALLAVGPEVGGLRQRLLLLAVGVWQLTILLRRRDELPAPEEGLEPPRPGL
jgi:hypothetical protein